MPKRIRSGERYLLAPGEWLPGKERYQIQGFLGQGAFAAAYKAQNEKGEVCFVKEYFPARRPSQNPELARVYATERDVVRRIGNYELIPRFWDAFQHEGFSYLLTDFIPGPDLETVMRAPNKPEVELLLRWSVCLCHELAYLHSRNVVHHDLKPDNVRLNPDGDPVIVDFSAAHWYRAPGETTDQLYGSDSFLAPEYAERGYEDADAGKKMDVFAMGRILVELIVGKRMSQEEIDQRQDQIYGEILHQGKIDVSFLRAVFRAVAYDPEKRYSSGVELAEEIAPSAPPLGRVRPSVVDFGVVQDAAPREANVRCYNAGGGTLRGELTADPEWLEISTQGAVTSRAAMFERNRQTVRVVAFPERLPPGGAGAGRVLFDFHGHYLEVPVLIRRTAEAADVRVTPAQVRLHAPTAGFGQARLTFANQGSAPASVRLTPPVDVMLAIEPEAFTLPAGGKQEVLLSMDAGVIGDREIDTQVEWEVEGNERPAIPVNAAVRRAAGLLGSLFKKK